MKDKDKPRAAGYIRVSTQMQASEGESLSTQRKQIETHATAKGWELAEIYEDAGISGAKDNRPGLQALLEAVKQRRLDAVIVRDLSRFGRSARDLLNNAKILKDCGVNFISIKENIDLGNNYGQFMFTVLSAIAELEREMIHDRMYENKMARWREKRIFNGRPPYAYQWNKKTCSIELIPEQAAIYQRVVTEYLDLGKSIRNIALGLTRDAIPTKYSGKWTVPTIRQFLRNPAYLGTLVANEKRLNEKNRPIGDKPASEHIIYECPPLITKSRWDEVQKRLESGRQERSGRPIAEAQHFLLHGMLRCGECGGKVVPCWNGAKRADGSPYRYYACYWKTSGKGQLEIAKRSKCTLPMIPAEQLDNYIFRNHLMARLGLNREKYLTPALDFEKWERKIESAQRRLEQHQENQRRKGIALKNIDSLLEDPEFDPEAFKGKRNGLLAEIRMAEQEITVVVAEIESLHRLREQEDLLTNFANDKGGVLRDAYLKLANLPDEGKQRLLRGMLAGPIIIKRPETADPTEKFGDGDPMEWLDFSFRLNPAILKEVLDLPAETVFKV